MIQPKRASRREPDLLGVDLSRRDHASTLAKECKGLPFVRWIHGGGWRAGDKSEVPKKPQAFVDKGYVGDEKMPKELSSVTPVAKGKNTPPFMLIGFPT